jgi:hypothetical protein
VKFDSILTIVNRLIKYTMFISFKKIVTASVLTYMSRVCNETDAQLIISKYKKNTMKKKRKASYRDKKVSALVLES